ncbi:cation transporter [Flagellimonas sp. HMM57]|uniref:heavy-metal-associated domain-containing protein n=1 Tax=unclassified Flagellimonas TaxID=2644544 RepID=UPI0013D07B2B|nr:MULTISPECIES: heavy metal-associated domain-containing protein [unclassified Flagellimonas]UII74714.1 cation transporter [Flagellimonas sp. HMM57]
MEHTYSVSGMTCEGCVASVSKKLLAIKGVEHVEVDLNNGKARIISENHVQNSILQDALGSKYGISEIQGETLEAPIQEIQSKWVQLRPLFLIFMYLFVASFLLNFKNWNTASAMLDFMGLFYIVFSFFKLLDLKGFPESFRMYDPLAKAVPVYGWIYPFLELGLGLLFLMRIEVEIALVATILVLGITTFGVIKTLVDKKSIRCACLGTALKLPMTEATFIENAIMLVMAFWMLGSMI